MPMSTRIQLLMGGQVCPLAHGCAASGTNFVDGLPSVTGHGRASSDGIPSAPWV